MPKEIELKFSATEAQLRTVKRFFGDFSTTKMETTYYDTPDRQLSAAKITLRRRKENGRSICTVKTPGQGFARGEWEWEGADIQAALPELCKLGAPEMLLQLTDLTPLCGARFTRLSQLLSLAGCDAELALDRGVLLGGGKKLPFCEVELELKKGNEADFFVSAEIFQRMFPLPPEPKSKFARALELTADPG